MLSDTDFEVTKLVHQILIADDFGLPNELPPTIAENVRSVQTLHQAATYRLWDGNSLRELIRQNYGREVLDAFELLQPYAYKADLARFCLLYLQGGLYVDLGIRLINPIKPPVEINFRFGSVGKSPVVAKY
jgi:mannosyltransferase OCH1-like enzyme